MAENKALRVLCRQIGGPVLHTAPRVRDRPDCRIADEQRKRRDEDLHAVGPVADGWQNGNAEMGVGSIQ